MQAPATNRWKLGLFVVMGLVLAFAALIWLGYEYFRLETIDAVTYFDESVQGLEEGSQVMVRGILVGSVVRIGPAPDGRHVEVLARLDRERFCKVCLIDPRHSGEKEAPYLPSDVRAQLALAGITGQKFLLIDFLDPEKYPPEPFGWELSNDAIHIPSVPSALKSFQEAAVDTLESLPRVLSRASDLMEELLKAVQELGVKDLSQRVRRTMELADTKLGVIDTAALAAKSERFLDAADVALAELRETMGGLRDVQGPLQSLLGEAGALVTDMKKVVAEVRLAETASSLREASSSVGAAAGSVSGHVMETARRIERLANELESDLEALRETLQAVQSLAVLLERDPGAVLHGKSSEKEPSRQP
ncbi:MAG: MlaD family protein [Planctomycetota bacterium]